MAQPDAHPRPNDAPEDGFAPDDELGLGDPAGPLLRYGGGDALPGLPTRAELVRESDRGESAALARQLAAGEPVFFMPVDVYEVPAYEHDRPTYELRLYGPLADGSKAEVTLTGIPVFFDVEEPASAAPAPPPAGGPTRAGAPDALGDLYGAPPAAPRSRVSGAAAAFDAMRGAAKTFDAQLLELCRAATAPPTRVEAISAYPLRGYRTAPRAYRRLHFADLAARKKALAAVREAGLATASDDRTAYYRKAAREAGLPLADWAELTAYTHNPGLNGRSPLCAHIFRLAAGGCRPRADPTAPKAARDAAARARAADPRLAHDRTLVVGWDLETHSGRGGGDLPRAEHEGDVAFMACLTAHWKDDAAPLRQLCLVDVEAAPDARWVTVVCGSPANVLRALALALRALAPDVVVGFNDSGYDWPFVVEKASQRGELAWTANALSAAPRRTTDEGVRRWDYRREQAVKVGAEESVSCSYLKLPGWVPLDARVCCKKMFPKTETPKAGSLRYYLGLCGLGGKADLPIARMWRYYEAARALPPRPLDATGPPATAAAREAAERMRHVAHYCVVDALRCQQLLARRAVLNDYRELATLASVSLADVHYYADGMKVCNVIGAYAWRRGTLMSMIAREAETEGKYPGAFVFPPKKGLENRRPVTGLDFASLYPSLIMAYNLSPDRILLDAAEAAAARAAGEALHEIAFPYGGRTVRGWSVRAGGVEAKIGLYPAALIDLFARRAEVKGVMGGFAETKELLEHVAAAAKRAGCSAWERLPAELAEARAEAAGLEAALAPGAPPPRVSPGSTPGEELAELARRRRGAAAQARELERLRALGGAAALAAEYEQASFGHACADSKQRALKLVMNTLYGVAGQAMSPLFLLELAGGVTSAGQYNIKRCAEFAQERGFRLKYGDTDSLYLIAPEAVFADCDADFAAGRLDREAYWTAMVRITMRSLNALRDEVNAFLAADNGTRYLKMAYEEVLFPVAIVAKKKYWGIAHVNIPNFHPKRLFVRGIDVVKMGLAGITRTIGTRVMWAAMAVDNERGLQAIVEDVLRDAVVRAEQWRFEDFVQTDAWKPAKKNLAVQRFVARMRGRHAVELAAAAAAAAAGAPAAPFLYALPEPGERFRYIVPRRAEAYDLRGRKAAAGKGDRMEYAAAAEALGLEPDVAYYLGAYVVGVCARFVCGEPRYAPPAASGLDEAAADKYEQAAAVRALTAFVAALGPADTATLRLRGTAFQAAYRRARAAARGALAAEVGGPAAQVLDGPWLDFETLTQVPPPDAGAPEAEGAEDARAVGALWAAAGALAEPGLEAWCRAAEGHPAAAALAAPRPRRPAGAAAAGAAALNRGAAAARAELAARRPAAADAAARYEADLERLVHAERRAALAARPALDGPGALRPAPGPGPAGLLAVTAADRPPLLALRAALFAAAGVQLTQAAPGRLALHLRRLREARSARDAAAAADAAGLAATLAAAAEALAPWPSSVAADAAGLAATLAAAAEASAP